MVNDNLHTFEFVIAVLTRVLGHPNDRAFQLTMEVHNAGRAVVWTGPRHEAERKCRLIRGYNEVRHSDNAQLGPIGCTIEPA